MLILISFYIILKKTETPEYLRWLGGGTLKLE